MTVPSISEYGKIVCGLIGCTLILLSSVFLASSANLLKNPSFENGLNHWQYQRTDNATRVDKNFTGSLELSPYYYDRKLTFSYLAEIVHGELAKSVLHFKIFGKDGKLYGNVGIVLNGEKDYWGHINNVVEGTLYRQIVVNTAVGNDVDIQVPQILSFYNAEAAKYAGATTIAVENVERIEVAPRAWSKDKRGQVEVVYKGLSRFSQGGAMIMGKQQVLKDSESLLKAIYYFPVDGLNSFEHNHHVQDFYQTVQTKPGEEYILSFSTKNIYGPMLPLVQVLGPDGMTIGKSSLPMQMVQTGWTKCVLPFTATGLITTIRISGVPPIGNDGIRVTDEIIHFSNLFDDFELLKKFVPYDNGPEFSSVPFDVICDEECQHRIHREMNGLNIPQVNLEYGDAYWLGQSWEKTNSLVWRWKRGIGYRNMFPMNVGYDKGRALPARIKSRGVMPVHYCTRYKSIRLNYSKKQRFDLLNPRSRGYLAESISYELARSLGLVHMQNDFVYVSVNDVPIGPFWRFARNKDSLELSKRPAGYGLTGDASTLGILTRLPGKDWKVDIKPDKAYRKQFPARDVMNDANKVITGNSIEAFKGFFNTNTYYAWMVHAFMQGLYHQNHYHNLFYYWNTAAGNMELIPWDVRFSGKNLILKRYNHLYDFVMTRAELYDEFLQVMWEYYDDMTFLERYLETFEKLEENVVPAFLKSIQFKDDSNNYLQKLDIYDPAKFYQDNVLSYRKHFSQRQKTLQRQLSNSVAMEMNSWAENATKNTSTKYYVQIGVDGPFKLTGMDLNKVEQASLAPVVIRSMTVDDPDASIRNSATGELLPSRNGTVELGLKVYPDLYRTYLIEGFWYYDFERLLKRVEPEERAFLIECYPVKKKARRDDRPIYYCLDKKKREEPEGLNRLDDLLVRYGVLPPRSHSFEITHKGYRNHQVSFNISHMLTGEPVAYKIGNAPLQGEVATCVFTQKLEVAKSMKFNVTDYSETFFSPEDFVARNPQFILDDEGDLLLPKGNHTLRSTVIVPRKTHLTIEPGTTISMEGNASIVTYSPVTANGTADAPIRFQALSPEQGWGTIAVQSSPGESFFSHTLFEDGNEAYVAGVYYSGMVSIYYSDVRFSHCVFSDANDFGGDDSLNVKYGLVQVRDSIFESSGADSIDFDFVSKGSTVSDCLFIDSENDCVDVSGSELDVSRIMAIRCNDKGLSAGEGSVVTVYDSVFDTCMMGMASKDDSRVLAKDLDVRNCGIGATVYLKKKRMYSVGSMDLKHVLFKDNRVDIAPQYFGNEMDKQSSITVSKSKFIPAAIDTVYKIAEPKKKLSKKKYILAVQNGILEDYGYKYVVLNGQHNIEQIAGEALGKAILPALSVQDYYKKIPWHDLKSK